LQPLRKLVVIGVGLIGGSLALALKSHDLVGRVVGVGRSRANLDQAVRAGIVDVAMTLDEPWTSELRDADVVVVATPVAQIPNLFAAMADSLGSQTIVTDAGSTKQDVVAAARAHLRDALPRFVPAHPIAGTERSGAAAAFPTLYEGRSTILTPGAETDAQALARVRALWEACGARVVELDPRTHDRILAAVSHLPHLLAAAYVAELAVRGEAEALFAYAGAGFRDFTRIAAASPEMWRDITLANRDALIVEIAAYRGALDVIESAMQQDDGESLKALFQSASDARRAWGHNCDDG
jgi:prephenate dehydrogenase